MSTDHRAHAYAHVLAHGFAIVVATVGIPAVLLAGTLASRLSGSILSDDIDSAIRFALGYAVASAAIGPVLAMATSAHVRNGRPLVARWGPVAGLVLLGMGLLVVTAMSAWSWGHSIDGTVRQNVAEDTRHYLPLVTLATFIGALSIGLWSRARHTRHPGRRILVGVAFAIPPIVAAVLPLLLAH